MQQNITITLNADNPNAVFALIKSLGMHDATLNGNTVTGTVSQNMVNPLRSVAGVENIAVNTGEEPPKQERPLTEKLITPDPSPVVPSKTDDPQWVPAIPPR